MIRPAPKDGNFKILLVYLTFYHNELLNIMNKDKMKYMYIILYGNPIMLRIINIFYVVINMLKYFRQADNTPNGEW